MKRRNHAKRRWFLRDYPHPKQQCILNRYLRRLWLKDQNHIITGIHRMSFDMTSDILTHAGITELCVHMPDSKGDND